MEIPTVLTEMLSGTQGLARQMAARLVIDLGLTSTAVEFVEVDNAHVSGVSVITGGHGLQRFLAEISHGGTVSIPTTLNAAGCDKRRMEEMDIEFPDFLEQQFEIIQAYERLGIEATLSCTPYDRAEELGEGIASWAESNAVAYANSWTSLITNRESGLSALATALTGYSPRWGLHLAENRRPNIVVDVECELTELCDWSILGDWIGKQCRPDWLMPYGPMPFIRGLEGRATFAQRKAMTAAAANYGCPMLWVQGHSEQPSLGGDEHQLRFGVDDLASRYDELAPKGRVDLVVIGCPQASLEEIRRTAAAVRAYSEMGALIRNKRLWLFTSAENHALAEADGSISILEEAGALVLQDTCPEVTPYNRSKYNHILTNSLKAEHYLTSGLNKMPTSVMAIEDCVKHCFDADLISGVQPELSPKAQPQHASKKQHQTGDAVLSGSGLASQGDVCIRARAMVSDVPITYLGYVNRDSGVIEETGHPLDGQKIENTILIYPKGSGSTVAPFVLMGLIYSGKGPQAIVNRDVCPLTLPACSLLDVPYVHGFDEDPCIAINNGDLIELKRNGDMVSIEIIERVGSE